MTTALGLWTAILEAVRDRSDPRYNPFDWETWYECAVFRAEVEGLMKGRWVSLLAEARQQFRLKAVPLTDDVVEWRERPHDDLVFAVAVAAWQGDRHSPLFFICLNKTKGARRGRGGRSHT
jgi:hypothetical protein